MSYECDKLRKTFDFVIIDTPPKVDADLRPALRAADLVIVPVAASQVDVWATESVLDLAKREGRPVMIVLNRAKQGTRVLDEVGKSLDAFEVLRSDAMLGNRVAYAETLGQGLGVLERGRGAWTAEVEGLAAEVRAALQG